RSPAFGARVGLVPEIPALVIDAHRRHVVGRKGNLLVPADLDNAAFAYDNLLENSCILQLHGDNLITKAGFFRVLQVFRTPTGNRNQPFHYKPPAELEYRGSGIVRYSGGAVYHRGDDVAAK